MLSEHLEQKTSVLMSDSLDKEFGGTRVARKRSPKCGLSSFVKPFDGRLQQLTGN